MPLITVAHRPDGSDFTLDTIAARRENGTFYKVTGIEMMINIFTREDNLYKQISVLFNLSSFLTYEQFTQTYRPAFDSPNFIEIFELENKLTNDLSRHDLIINQHQ